MATRLWRDSWKPGPGFHLPLGKESTLCLPQDHVRRASYLRTSAEGLDYRLWPFWEIRSGWGDLQSLHRGRLLGDALYLQPTEKIGFLEFAIVLGQPQIHLSSLEGWPDGGLEDELREYAPQLFANLPSS